MSTYADLVARIVPNLRAMMAGQGQSGVIDEGRVEQSLVEVLGVLADVVDLDALVVFDTPLATTATGIRSYALPTDFGRTLTYRSPDQTGLFCHDGTRAYELRKVQTLDLVHTMSSTNGRPAQFVLTASGITLDPPPDSNSGSGYTIRGTYLQKLDYNTFDFQQEVLVQFPQALQDAAQLRYLGQEYTTQLTRLVNGEKRQRTELQWAYTPASGRRWQRRR